MESVDSRKIELLDWLLSSCDLRSVSLLPIAGDASTRRYFRVLTPDQTYVAMDAPPPEEDCASFIAIAQSLRNKKLFAPEIFKSDLERGYLLLTDMGEKTYLDVLDAENADKLYGNALEALAVIQSIRKVPDHKLPAFDADLMRQEWAWFKEWYLGKLLKMGTIDDEQQLDACYDMLVDSATTQPQVFMHRDYHSANLMVLPDDEGVGLLDFQDAFIGPLTYDPVSLLRDCYIDWPEEKVASWANAYRLMLKDGGSLDVEQDVFVRWFDLMGVQRHLKALMTFARKEMRDKQSRYLVHVPRTINYLINTTGKYPELAPLNNLLQTIREMSDKCVA